MKEGDNKQSGSADVTDKIYMPAAMMENGGKADVTVTLRQLLANKTRHGMPNSPPLSPPFVWDTEANQQPSAALSPISTQDLTPGASQDMPVSSTAFQWTGEHSLTTSAVSRSNVESSSGGGTHPLTDWTHFGDSISSLHASDASSQDARNILQELLKETPDSSNALLRSILSEKPNVDDSKEIRLLLGDPNMTMSNGSPNSMQHDPLYNTFMQNLNDLSDGSNPPHKRKIEELDGADAGNPAKLSDKNKLLADLLRSNKRDNEIPAAGLPTPNPGDLPQNKLPKDLPSRIIPALGQQRSMPNGVHRNGGGGASGGGGGLGDFINMENSSFVSRNGLSAEQMDLFDLIDELQESALGAPDSMQSNPLTPVDKQAIDSIRLNLLQDFPNGPSAPLLSDVMPYRDQPLASPGSMIPKYNINQGGNIPRPQMHNFSNNGDMLLQRLPGPGGHMMLPNHVSPPSRPGPIPQDFSGSRSPAPPSAIPSSHVVRQQIRMTSWNRQVRAQNQAQQSNVVNMGQQGTMQMSNVTPNVTIGRSFSIPNAGPHGGYPVNGYQNVPQQNNQRFSGQQTVPYSPPPTNMQFQVPGPGQPLSPRHLSSAGGRMTRPNNNNGMWMQQQQMAGMGAGANQMSSANQMNVGAQMNVAGPQQNPPPYANQQFINQSGSQQNFNHPSQMLQQQNLPQRFPGQGGAQAVFNQQQAMLQQQQDTFGNGNNFYPRGMPGSSQPRMALSGQNSQMMRSSLADDLRSNEGTFGQYQLNGVSSAPPSANPQQQTQFRWDLPGDRQNMTVPANSGMNGGNASRIGAPALDPGFQHFDSFFDAPSNGSVNGLSQGQLHMNEQQQFRGYPNDNQHLLSGHMQQQQQTQQQHSNQSFASLSTSASCGELMGLSHTGNSPQHMQPGDRSKSLLQQLLSDNAP